jgi:hypothetical protein
LIFFLGAAAGVLGELVAGMITGRAEQHGAAQSRQPAMQCPVSLRSIAWKIGNGSWQIDALAINPDPLAKVCIVLVVA